MKDAVHSALRRLLSMRRVHRIRTQLVLLYSLAFLTMFSLTYLVNSTMLQNQFTQNLVRGDAVAVTQISASLRLVSDLVAKNVVSLYSARSVQWFFSNFANVPPANFRAKATESSATAANLRAVRQSLRDNTFINATIDSGAVLIAQEGQVYTAYDDMIIPAAGALTELVDEWDAHFSADGGRYCWTTISDREPIYYRDSPGSRILACVYDYRRSGAHRGYIVVMLNQEDLRICFDQYTTPEMGNQIYLCAAGGQIITASDTASIGGALPSRIGEKIREKRREEANYGTVSDQGDLYSYAYIQARDWLLVSKVPAAYFAKTLSPIRRLNLVIFAIAGLVAVLLIFMLTAQFSRRIERLKHVMKSAPGLNYQTAYPVEVGDELDEIGESLNQMLDDINLYVRKLTEEMQKQKESELDFLHAQINTHFLYNTLNSVKMLALLKRNEQIGDLITSLVRFLKATVSVTSQIVSLEEEQTIVRHYISIQNITRSEHTRLEVRNGVDPSAVYVPKLLLQPIVENSILHAFTDAQKDGCIALDARREGEGLCILITDNGCGMPPGEVEPLLDTGTQGRSHAIGLRNVKERIELLFGGGYGLHIDSAIGRGTTVRLWIPYMESETFDQAPCKRIATE